MARNLIYRYFLLILIVFLCIITTGLTIIFFTYDSLKNTIFQNIERNTGLIADDFDNKFLGIRSSNDFFTNKMLELYSKNLRMDIYIYDANHEEVLSNSFNDDFFERADWKFSSEIQKEISPSKNLSYMEKFEVNIEPYEIYIGCVMPYTKVSVHTDKAVNVFLAVALLSIIFSTIFYWVYNFFKFKSVLRIEKCFVGENISIPIPKRVTPEYEPLVEGVKAIQERINYNDRHMVEFISNISHELKSPLTVIKGFLGAIIDGTIESEHRYTYLVKILNEAERMHQIIKNMLNVSHIEAGKITLNTEVFNILDVIAKIIFMFEKQIEEKNIKILIINYPEIAVFGDKILLHQVFYNLIENAIKFVDEGGCISISAKYSFENILFQIKNTGNGVPQKDLAHVFDRFFKSDYSRSDNPDGIGLGLSIVRKFVNQHNGHITISSEEGSFTEFTLTFPKDFVIK